MQKLQLGNITVHSIVELDVPIFGPRDFFDEALPEAIDPHRHWLEPDAIVPANGLMVMPVQSYLLQSPRHTILVDTCIGCHKSYDGIPGWEDRRDQAWLHRLAGAGIRIEDIDFVFCTHLHVDHCGWNTRLTDGRWTPTFPNAKYIFSQSEYAASEAGDGVVFRESVQPIMEAGQAVLVESDYALDDQIWLTPSPGHTPGHVCINFASRGSRAIATGDLMHSPLQLAYPCWSPNFDFDPALSAETRLAFLDAHCNTDILVMTAHFPLPSMGHVVSHADREFDFTYLQPG